MSAPEPGPIAYTMGDPAGIGPDLALLLASRGALDGVVVIGSIRVLAERSRALGLDVELLPWPGPVALPGQLSVKDISCPVEVNPGIPDPAYAPYVLEALDAAVDGCMRCEYSAMVTGPVNKAVINQAGIPFLGHTEYLSNKTGTPCVVMMLATEGLRVALLTTHLPLSAVSEAISRQLVEQVLRIIDDDFRSRLGISHPRILVCGLNPHAGEGGHLGTEEIESITPAIRAMCEEGLNIVGPVPADTAFTDHHLRDTDVVLSMYHDQGLPVLKHKGFGRATNVTLGLPIVRASVDHGTAFDLAGGGKIDTGSLLTSIEFARSMIRTDR